MKIQNDQYFLEAGTEQFMVRGVETIDQKSIALKSLSKR
jgi:hypothetical protein